MAGDPEHIQVGGELSINQLFDFLEFTQPPEHRPETIALLAEMIAVNTIQLSECSPESHHADLGHMILEAARAADNDRPANTYLQPRRSTEPEYSTNTGEVAVLRPEMEGQRDMGYTFVSRRTGASLRLLRRALPFIRFGVYASSSPDEVCEVFGLSSAIPEDDPVRELMASSGGSATVILRTADQFQRFHMLQFAGQALDTRRLLRPLTLDDATSLVMLSDSGPIEVGQVELSDMPDELISPGFDPDLLAGFLDQHETAWQWVVDHLPDNFGFSAEDGKARHVRGLLRKRLVVLRNEGQESGSNDAREEAYRRAATIEDLLERFYAST